MSGGTKGPADGPRELVRLSVVLTEDLEEHVRLRAFQTRMSKSAYVRHLVDEDRHQVRTATDEEQQ